MSLTGNVGRVARLSANMLPAALNQRVACLRLKDSAGTSKDFLFQFLNSDYFESHCILSSKGIAQKNMSTEWLKEYEIPLFTPKEQLVIASQLSKIDNLIAGRYQMLVKLDELVKSRFVEMFGEPVTNSHGYEQVTIGNACTLINGRAFKPSEWGEKGLPIVRIQNLNDMNASFNYYAGEVSEQHLIDNGMLLFSWSGTPGTSFGAFMWNRGPGALNQHIFKVIPKLDFDLDYLRYAMNGQLTTIIEKAHGGVGLQHITKAELEKICLLHPEMAEQKRFAAFAKQVDKSKLAVKQSLEKLETLKKSLMQQYFG